MSYLMGRTSVEDLGQHKTFSAHQKQLGCGRSGSPRHSRGVMLHTMNQTPMPMVHFEIMLWARKEQKKTGFMPKAATLTGSAKAIERCSNSASNEKELTLASSSVKKHTHLSGPKDRNKHSLYVCTYMKMAWIFSSK